ncbi:hypothetical protein IU433_29675 [Nocardia puris]|uniref:Diacylglycerol kinase family enzyme n=1 Tax=Nocardia puris TaxID=208602 RepID=A0A366CWH6_9NOCA|nr:diacylglycerol kinase family protein [Nocardia puris]MBF6215982.1 hypothetical protein [Nocardia puris]MBF6370268.1 hypothetical protein [Nocardia puris]MBF6463174.1 hypothetical protein [Nocardia puris]RBO80087.1 diacylglycerol kinase family enzyme [Nocardia puris]
MLVVLNPHANAGAGLSRWEPVESALRHRYSDVNVEMPADADQAVKLVRTAVDAGAPPVIAAAGGDGMVHLVLNALMDPATDRPRAGAENVALGAVGLGSSNDFHKPVAEESRINGVPVRVDAASAEPVDIGKATLTLSDGSTAVRYFLLNASVGLVAAGNHSFNHATGLVGWLKGRNVEAAIIATALRNIVTHRPLDIRVSGDNWTYAAPVTNVGVLKSVHFAGGMRYDTPVTRTDGMFDVNIWERAGRWQTVGLIAALYRGQFTGRPRTVCERASAVELRPAEVTPLELDGEITMVKSARLEVLPRALKVCAA